MGGVNEPLTLPVFAHRCAKARGGVARPIWPKKSAGHIEPAGAMRREWEALRPRQLGGDSGTRIGLPG
jgi:hypothetical protein